ncbi:SulP family inorganic anion transporter [Oceanobacillus bengalensis]|uniref:Sodium-independent anion transporter n=1 Tax=Oceanobacillus bengalensis TaxID=1435466 RepID=A0A494YSX9_9BACI|nr:SulP family inorganic anion transporter [Oceanobacillus bengalensis]RKQ13196.1 sodium-independent anion transporter [Oceanobacillus bengalensis]
MLYKIFPGLKQIIEYSRLNITGDLTAGMTVAVLLIPQSMAYATIAGVPLHVGLYAAIFPVFFYILFGGASRYLSVGPVSVVSLLAFSGISSLDQSQSLNFLESMIILSFIVGFLQVVWGFFKLGSIFHYVSEAVLNGFIAAVGIIIILNQLDSFLGVSLPAYENLITFSSRVITHLHAIHPYTFGIALGCIIALYLIKKKFPTIPAEFIIIIASVIIVESLALYNQGVDIIGKITFEFPQLPTTIPTADLIFSLLPIALVIAFISFVESYAVAMKLATNDKEPLDPNQELRGLGAANIGSSMVGSIPIAGAISRTAVNYKAGAKSNLSLFVAAVFVLMAIIYLTPFFYYLPKATLAAIIIFAISNLINFGQLLHYVKNKMTDALIYLSTFLTTLMVDIFLGLVVGMITSFFLYTKLK